MSAIIDKVYDATKRIYKSVFKGAPNLITTADLNRQMSAFQAQLENLYRFVGPITDLSFTFEQDNENPSFSASYTLSKMVARGCDFTNLLPASGTNGKRQLPQVPGTVQPRRSRPADRRYRRNRSSPDAGSAKI